MSKLDEIRARLEAQQDAQDEARETQEAIDLEALYDAREEHGVSAVMAVRIPYVPGLPVHAIVRRPKPIEFKRFQDMCTKKDGGPADNVKAAEQIASTCLVYPLSDDGKPGDVFAKMVVAVPGLKLALGTAAVNLAAAKQREDQKT